MLPNWNLQQYKAAGKHVASFAAGAVGMAAAMHFISPSQAVTAQGDLTQIFTGLQQVATGCAGLAAILVPIYTAWRAAHNQAPQQLAVNLLKTTPTLPTEAKAALVNVATTPTVTK